jgi:2-oxoglutarate dehydrogenase E1 component
MQDEWEGFDSVRQEGMMEPIDTGVEIKRLDQKLQ